jgi:DNA-binding LacI/PurR family transcriptional regulator
VEGKLRFPPSNASHPAPLLKVSRKDIAAAAQVSVSTVGMILSGQGERYSEETRKRVLDAAAQLGYQPSINARALRLNRSLLIGVLLYEVNSHLSAQFLQGVQEAITDTHYSPLVFFSKAAGDQEVCLEHCLSREVDALIVNCAVDPAEGIPQSYLQRLAALPIPVVEVFGQFLPGVAKVNIDNARAGALATRHLIELGHRRIALLTHSRYQDSQFHADAWEQSQGYHAEIEEAGLQPLVEAREIDFVNPTAANFMQAGHDALPSLLAMPGPPTAVVCYSDYFAYGLNRACRIQGTRVPDDLSIAGNLDLLLSNVVNPPLTTARPRFFEIGRLVGTGLLKTIEGATLTDQLVAPELVIRESTGSAPAGKPR